MADRTIKQNDTGPALNATLTDANGAINLSSAEEIKILVKSLDADPPVTWSGVCSIIDASLGKVRYTWRTNGSDTAVAAVYNIEFEITWSDGTVWTVPNAAYNSLEVMADLG